MSMLEDEEEDEERLFEFVTDEVHILNVDLSQIAHDKDINSVCVSPNDKLVATGSQDKTAKVTHIQIINNSFLLFYWCICDIAKFCNIQY